MVRVMYKGRYKNTNFYFIHIAQTDGSIKCIKYIWRCDTKWKILLLAKYITKHITVR
jgi:hypothetical protein